MSDQLKKIELEFGTSELSCTQGRKHDENEVEASSFEREIPESKSKTCVINNKVNIGKQKKERKTEIEKKDQKR